MKLVIDGREYDPAAQPFLGDLRLLKPEFGFGWGEVVHRLEGIDEDANWIVLLDDDDFREALIAWMWMSRLRAGERECTAADAAMVGLDAIGWKLEPGDQPAEVDESVPTSAPAVSSRGGAVTKPGNVSKPAKVSAAGPGTNTSSKTSRRRSSAA